ncbi:MAG: hypothetical protein HYY06_19580 [Deltaproteobacteria bacterium]|nr:hypothetical protein [Deltaproteobacteria bacterium]
MRPAPTAALCAILLLTAAPARADEVIVLRPIVPADFAARLSDRLSREAASRLAAAGLTVRQGADIEVAAQAAAECRDARCLKDRLGATGARLAARIRIEASPAGFVAKLEVASLAAGIAVAAEEADCSGCTAQAAVEVALSLIDGIEIPERDPEPPPESSHPTGSVAPRAAPPRARLEEPALDLRPPPPASRRISKWAWISGAAGLAFVAGGIPLLSMDGDPTCDGPSRSCPEVYDTRSGGWSLVAIGAAGVAAAVVMAIVGAPGEAPAGSEVARVEP